MAELNNTTQTQEPVYLNYGADQIDQQAFLDAAANNVQQYVNNQTWSAKRKQKFLDAYSDIMSKGIIGANNKTGQWAVDLNSNIDLESMDRKDQEMYHEAAYYILQQMKGITPKAKEEEKKKSDLPVFNNDYFTEQFQGYIGNQLFGGRDWDRNTDWNVLDEADKYGIRGTDNRAEKLASMLEGYRDFLKEEDLNFEGSPFTDLNDFKTKVNNAINQLRNKTWNQGDIDALNQIGINPETYMSTGANDMNPEGTMTRQQWKEALEKQEADKLAAEQKDAQAKALVQQQANAGVLTPINGINAVEAINQAPAYAEYLGRTYGVGQQGFNAINTAIQGLIEKGYNNGKGGGLTNAEKKQLGNLLYYIRQNNPNYQKSNLSDQDWAELNLHKNLGSTNRVGYVRLPWQTSDGRYTYADDKGNVYFLKPQNKAKIAGPAFNRSTAYNDYKNNFLKSENNKALNTTIGSNNGLTDDMKADLAAMGLDLVSAGSAFAPGYGTLASAVTGIGATLTGAYADRARGESWSSTLGTAGFGLSMDILGLIPGVGVGAKAAKIAKVVAKGAKWIGPALGGLAAMSYGPGALSAYKKFTSGKKDDITAEELRDFTYAIRAIAAGGIRKAGATYQGNRTLARAVKEGKAEISSGKQAASITTKNGQKINLTDGEFKTLKSNANRETKAKTITQAAQREKINMEGDEIEWKGVNPVKGRFKTSSKSSKLSGLQEGTESSQIKWNTTSANYKGIRRFSNENLLRGFTIMSGPSSGLWRSLRDRWNGNDILNSNSVSASQKEAVKQELKALPRKPYNKPTASNQEVIPESRRLPQPGGEHKGTRIDVQRTGTSLTKNISTGEAVKEFTDFDRMYISSSRKNSKVPSKAFGNGYGTSKEPESGSLDFNGITATVTKLDGDRGFTLAFGKTKDTVMNIPYKNIQELRSSLAQQLNKVIKKQNNVKETAALLRQFKAKGWLKQGGQINNFDLDKTISEFLNKQK